MDLRITSDPLLPARFYDPAIYDEELHKLGVLCVECSHPDNVESQRKLYHPADRGCVLRNGVNEPIE